MLRDPMLLDAWRRPSLPHPTLAGSMLTRLEQRFSGEHTRHSDQRGTETTLPLTRRDRYANEQPHQTHRSGNPHHFVRLNAQPPLRVPKTIGNRHLGVAPRLQPVHGLEKKVRKIQLCKSLWHGSSLRKNQL